MSAFAAAIALRTAVPADAARLTEIAFAAKRHWAYPESWVARWREAFGGLMQAHLNRGGLILAAVHDPLPILARPFELGAAR